MTQFQHPDDDLLADLAAEILPPEEAGGVEAHVRTCATCLQVLSDSEVVRSALLQIPLDPMPDDVLRRMRSVIQLEVNARSGESSLAAGRPGRSEWEDTSEFTSVYAAQGGGSRGKRAPLSPGGEDFAEPEQAPGANLVRAGAAGRNRTSTVRRERGSETGKKRSRPSGIWLSLAAAVTLIAAGGGLFLAGKLPNSSSDSAGSTAAISAHSLEGSVPAAGGAAAPMAVGTLATVRLSSGTAYTKAAFAAQTKALLEISTKPSATSKTMTSDAIGSPLAGQAGLAACIKTFQSSPGDVLTVDFATYEGAQAAVILLTVDGQTIQAWAVSPDCGGGSQVTLDFTQFSR
jgi:hypothetical protein